MPELLTPGLYFEMRDPAPVVRGVRTDIAGFVGIAERGPIGRPVRIESWRGFQAIYGAFITGGFLAYAVKGFFENGGRTCYIVRAAGATAERASLTLKNGSGADVIRVWASSEGRWGAKVSITITTASQSMKTFSIRVTHGTSMELFKDLSVDPKHPRYFLKMINEGDASASPSRWITMEALVSPPADMIPSPSKSGLKDRTGTLIGGKDGLASLTRDDIIGDDAVPTESRWGLCALDLVDPVGIVCIPDIHIVPAPPALTAPPKPVPPRDPCLHPPIPAAPPVPPGPQPDTPQGFSMSDILWMQRTIVEHCETLRDRVAILDAPLNGVTRATMTTTEISGWRSEFESERGYGALYYPWVKVFDPISADPLPVRAIPPSGHVAGLYAHTDLTIGVHKAPANAPLEWAEDVTVEVGDEEHGILNPIGVNCIRPFPGRGIRVFGARTISSNADWRYINIRRLLTMIQEAIDESTQWAVFEPHNFTLRQALIQCVSGFLQSIWRKGELAGGTAAEAFFVKCDDDNNPQDSVDAGKIIIDVGVAPSVPAEFIVFRIGRTVEELEIVER